MPLLVKAVTPKGTFVVISSMVTSAVQTLESVRTGSSSLVVSITEDLVRILE